MHITMTGVCSEEGNWFVLPETEVVQAGVPPSTPKDSLSLKTSSGTKYWTLVEFKLDFDGI